MVGRPRAGECRAAEGHPAPALGEPEGDDGKIPPAAGPQAGCRSRRGPGGRGGKPGQGVRDGLPQPVVNFFYIAGGMEVVPMEEMLHVPVFDVTPGIWNIYN